MFDLVEPGKPEESWLYLKLTAPTMAKAELVEDPAWGEPVRTAKRRRVSGSACRRRGSPSPRRRSARSANWILAGAPGP